MPAGQCVRRQVSAHEEPMRLLVQEDKLHSCAPNRSRRDPRMPGRNTEDRGPLRAPPPPLFKEDSGFLDAPGDNRPHGTSVPCPGRRDVDSSRLVISKVKPRAEVTPGTRTGGSRHEPHFLKRESHPQELRNPRLTLRPPGAPSLLNPTQGPPGLGACQLWAGRTGRPGLGCHTDLQPRSRRGHVIAPLATRLHITRFWLRPPVPLPLPVPQHDTLPPPLPTVQVVVCLQRESVRLPPSFLHAQDISSARS